MYFIKSSNFFTFEINSLFINKSDINTADGTPFGSSHNSNNDFLVTRHAAHGTLIILYVFYVLYFCFCVFNNLYIFMLKSNTKKNAENMYINISGKYIPT